VYLGAGPSFPDGKLTWVKINTVAATSNTMAFVDAGRINYWTEPQPFVEEDYYCDPPSNQYPGPMLGTAAWQTLSSSTATSRP
jgi:hypothetical protein